MKKTFDASLMSADEKELSQKSFDNIPEGILSLIHIFPLTMLSALSQRPCISDPV